MNPSVFPQVFMGSLSTRDAVVMEFDRLDDVLPAYEPETDPFLTDVTDYRALETARLKGNFQ